MKKKALSMIFTLVACTGLSTLSVSAAEVEYQVGPKDTDTITFETSTASVVAANPNIVTADIPATIDGVAVKAINDNVFWGTTLADITIPDSVTYIGEYAFYTCYSLDEVDIPDSVGYVGYKAFAECDALTSIALPKGMTSIEDDAFRNDGMFSSLTTAHIPDSVTKIGMSAFGKLTDVYYDGSKEQWDAIDIRGENEATSAQYYPNKDLLVTATIHYGTESTPANHSFTDVVAGSYYEKAVVWALENNVTAGTSDTTFEPNATCTRGQVVTFLWRANGCPEPDGNANPFTDVASSDYYYKAILWAVEQGITAGTSDTTFSPNATCTNAQVITFLWRANGEPDKINMSGLFYYSSAVNWATRNGVLIPNTLFEPEDNCPRSDVVFYLYQNDQM